MSVALSSPTLDQFIGLDATTGGELSGDAHLLQSLRDIITTPIGTRVMRRTYGSRVAELIDAPMNPGVVADIVAGVADAVMAWEPRVTLQQVIVQAVDEGGFTLDLIVASAGQVIKLEGVV